VIAVGCRFEICIPIADPNPDPGWSFNTDPRGSGSETLVFQLYHFDAGRDGEAAPEDYATAAAGPEQAGGREQEDLLQQLARHPPRPRPQQQRSLHHRHARHPQQTTQVHIIFTHYGIFVRGTSMPQGAGFRIQIRIGSAFLASLEPDPHFSESLDLDPDLHFDPDPKFFFRFLT